MKRYLIFLASLIFGQGATSQQINSGGFGHFMIGPAWSLSQKVDDYLAQPNVLGNSFQPIQSGVLAGGEGFAVINRVLIGGGGYGISHFSQSSDSGSLIKAGGGGYFKAGYIVWTRTRSFMTANIAFGGFGYTYEITNNRAQNGIYFNQEFPINKGETRRYTYGGTSFDFSYGIKTVVGKRQEADRCGGFMLGTDVGCLLNIATGDWVGAEDNIIGPPSPGMMAIPYIRLTIGGGGFHLK